MTENSKQSSSLYIQGRVPDLDDSVVFDNQSNNSHLRILFEGYPLTLKKGTGIHVYALNLLRGIDYLRKGQQTGLLLLLDEAIEFKAELNNSQEMKNIQNYAELLSELFQARYPDIGRDNPSNSTKFSKLLALIRKNKSIYLSVKYIFNNLIAVSFPDDLKPSLIEILNNSSIDYDFLKLNQVYLANISRKFLIGRCTYKIKNNKIYSPQLSETYDIFHCTHLSPLTVNKLPQVTTVHDIIPLIRPELVSNQSLLAFANLLKVNIKNSVKIIAVSQATKDDLVKYCQVPPEKVVVVYEAAREEFKPVDIEIAKPILKKLSLTSLEIDTPYFMFIGNIEPKKNIRRLLLAFKQFSMRDKRGCKLVIVGNKAWGFDDVKDLIKELINDGIVINTGYLQTNQIPSLLSHAQALIFPSLIEGFGLPVLEAMACGCPVITSDIPCIREITGDAALRVNPLSIDEIYQAIKSIAEDRSLRNRLHHAGLLQSQLFSWQRCAKETIAVYHEAIYEFYKYKQ